MKRLVLRAESAKGTLQLPLEHSGVMLIGRARDAALRLPDDAQGVERYHAMLELRDGGVWVRGLARNSVTAINGQAGASGVLRPGDKLTLGGVELTVAEESLGPDLEVDDSFTGELHLAREKSRENVRVQERLKELSSAQETLCDACHRRPRPGAVAAFENAPFLCASCAEARREPVSGVAERVGPFEVLRYLAAGGMGAVFEAWEPSSGARAAVKVLPPGTMETDRVRKRFVREQQINQQLRHPNIVRCYDAGEQDGQLYIVSEYVSGGDAQEWSKRGPGLAEVCWVGADLFRALAYAHKHDVVHRDLKPANILLTRPENTGVRRAKLTDFGLAKNVRESRNSITRQGEAGGSLLMMGPEQLTDFLTVGPVADVYSGAATIYRIFTGTTPLALEGSAQRASFSEVADSILKRKRVPLAERRPDLPAEICRIIDGLVALEGKRRAQLDPADMAEALDYWAVKYGQG